jgi:hypothetical protein
MSGMMNIILLISFVSCQFYLIGIYNNNMITAINMRVKSGLCLPLSINSCY